MKKILFALVGVATMMLTSCFENTGNSYTATFSRIVTIDTTSEPVKFIADYTGEVFKGIENLKYPEQLGNFGLGDACRADIHVQLHVDDSYKQTLTMLEAREISILPVTNQTPTDSLQPFLGWAEVPYIDPIVWVSNGYLNVIPIIPSEKAGKYYLTPEKAVNDTLYFNFAAAYEEDASKGYRDQIQCYDLRTLRDTAEADAELRGKMREILETMKQHQADSMRIVLVGDFIEYNFNHLNEDTVRTLGCFTNYFKYNF